MTDVIELLRQAGIKVSGKSLTHEQLELLKEFSRFPVDLQRQMLQYGRRWLKGVMK